MYDERYARSNIYLANCNDMTNPTNLRKYENSKKTQQAPRNGINCEKVELFIDGTR